jgi:rare lipoprotein A
MTCAHRTLPFGTKVKVTNMANGHTVTVTVNDRGPFAAGRIIDVSKKAAKKLGMVDQGVASVKIKYKRKK